MHEFIFRRDNLNFHYFQSHICIYTFTISKVQSKILHFVFDKFRLAVCTLFLSMVDSTYINILSIGITLVKRKE